MINMFCGGIHSCQSLPEVARCFNAFFNAISHVYSHTPTHRHGMAYDHVLHHAKKLKYEWEGILGIKLTDVPTTLPLLIRNRKTYFLSFQYDIYKWRNSGLLGVMGIS